ncbi:RNA-metabolising metallo-beta-lactamase [compost metagenome]
MGSERAWVDLDGERFEIHAKVMTLGGYSAHADQQGLIRFALGRASAAKQVVLVHGARESKSVLAKALAHRFAQLGNEVNVTVPP